MNDAPCSRKSFLAFGLCALASGLVGCSEDPGTISRAEGGSTVGGGSATAGSGGSATAGSAGSMATAGSAGSMATAGSAGSMATAGSAGSMATAGSAGSSATAGSAGSSGNGLCNADIVAKCSPAAGDLHTHVLIVSMAAITAGVEVMIETNVDQTGHTHTIPLTVADFLILKDGGVVIIDKCAAAPHQFVIRCGGIPEPAAPDCL